MHIIDTKRPTTRTVKVKEIQECGGLIHAYLNNQAPRGVSYEQFMRENPEDPRIPLMKDMIALDKQFREKLSHIIKIKENSDKEIRELLKKYSDTVILVDANTPNQKTLHYQFNSNDGYEKYTEELKKADDKAQKELDEFRESDIDITPVYTTKLPPFSFFPDKAELRNPLKGFILPLD